LRSRVQRLDRRAQDTIKVGVLHSLSGTMAISETVLKDTVLMAIDEINAKGGVLGKKLEPWWSTPPPTGRCSPRRPSS
jgi:ABC-type branched-subunit amino acid transport system substrate-binding protein